MDDHINTMPLYSNTFRNENGGSVVSYYSIRSTSQLETNVGDTKYVLRPGTYYFDTGGAAAFVLDKPFELDDSAGGTIDIIANIVYLGTGPLFQQAIGNQLILRLTDTVLVGDAGPPGTRTLFDLSYSAVGPQPILLIDFLQCVFWNALGTVSDFSTIVVSNYADQFNGTGLQIFDPTNLVNITTTTLTDNLQSSTRLQILQGPSLVTGPSIVANNIQFKATAINASALNIDPALQPNASVSGGVFDQNGFTGSGFFAPTGIDETSIFMLSRGVKNVADTKIGGSYFISSSGAIAFTQTINFQNQYYVPPGTTLSSPPIVLDTSERVGITTSTLGNRTLLTNHTPETARVRVRFSATISTPAASADYGVSIFRVFGDSPTFPQNVWDTFTGASSLITTGATPHGYTSGQFVVILFSTSIPGPLFESGIYVVSVLSPTSIELLPAPGDPPIIITTATSGVLFTNLCEQIGHVPQVGVKNTTNGSYVATDVPTISAANMNGAGNPDLFVPAIKNVSGTDNVNIYSYNFGINE